ncbi:hypothetical protein NBRC116592_03830 [Colwellia sp. KU-HH00111]|uniref:hypothetical protein n=1 Tax=Colwellia sp. KU-HH00111 TaxID=3127652 RepID=UPI00310310FD
MTITNCLLSRFVLFFSLLLILSAQANSNQQLASSNNPANYSAAWQTKHKAIQQAVNSPDLTDDIHCINIPTDKPEPSQSQLCILHSKSYQPQYSEMHGLFVKNKIGDITLLEHFSDEQLASLGYVGFSENGRYLYAVFTDEGHPYFVFFDSEKFINNQANAQVGEVFEEYFIDHIEVLYENGDFVFALREGTISGCLSGEVEIAAKTSQTDEVKRCLFHHNIFDQYSNLMSSDPSLPTRSKRQIPMPYVCKAFL